MKPIILVVADDASLRATLARWLLQAGYAVELAESPRRAHEVAANGGVTLAMVASQGLGAPGVELVHKLADSVARIIMIGDPAADIGTSDESPVCVALPLSEPDVLEKVRLVLHPTQVQEAPSTPQILRFEGYTLDAGARTCVDARGQELALTRAEFSLLLAFAQKSGRVLSRDELTRVVTGRGAEPEDRSVDVLISRLRRKIEPDPKTPRLILTVPGEGYRFTARPEVVAAVDSPVAAFDRQPAHRLPEFAAIAAVVLALIMAVVGWEEWSNRAALHRAADASPPAASPELKPQPVPPAPFRDEHRALVFKRMVTALQDNQYNWRSIERLAILSGVDESEAREILAEHPNEIVLGKSQEGKLLAKLAGR